MAQPAYKRILLKLSGEALMGDDAYGINRDTELGQFNHQVLRQHFNTRFGHSISGQLLMGLMAYYG